MSAGATTGRQGPAGGRRWAARETGERGAGTVLTAMVLLCLGVATAVGLVLASWIECMHAARASADLAALAGAGAHVRGLDACAAASASAMSNGAHVTACSIRGDAQAFSVRVQVSRPLSPAVRGAPKEVLARAVAGSGLH